MATTTDNVLYHPAHHRYRCKDDCRGCHTCEGGLFSCTRCNCAEGTLPTDCPGVSVDPDIQVLIHRGDIDYRWRDGWVDVH